MQRLWRQLRRLEELRHFAGRQLPRGVRLAQAVQTRVIPLLVFIQGYETRHAGFLLHTRWGERRVLLALAGPAGRSATSTRVGAWCAGLPVGGGEQQLPVKAGVSARLGTGSSTPTAGCRSCWGRYRSPPHGGARAQEDAPL